MITEVRMPRIDDSMTEGTVTRWLKNVGESIQTGEPVLEIETSKVTYEIEAPGNGLLRLILVLEGNSIPINELLGIIADEADDISRYEAAVGKAATSGPTVEEKPLQSSPQPAPLETAEKHTGRIRITPYARKLAAERGLELCKIRGTGPRGRITKDDVLRFDEQTEPRTPVQSEIDGRRSIREILPLSGMRKTIAERMSEGATRPTAQNFITVDVTDLVQLREHNKGIWEKEQGVRVSVTHFILAAAARALRAHPLINSSLQGDQIEIYYDINISVAVALEKGLITPVLTQADARDLFNIAREAQRLTALVRQGRFSADILANSTFTVTNLGMFDIDFFVPILNPPESAILAIGKIDKKPVIIQDAIAIRSVMIMCLTYDHRLIDGALAARFLQHIKKALETPVTMIV